MVLDTLRFDFVYYGFKVVNITSIPNVASDLRTHSSSSSRLVVTMVRNLGSAE